MMEENILYLRRVNITISHLFIFLSQYACYVLRVQVEVSMYSYDNWTSTISGLILVAAFIRYHANATFNNLICRTLHKLVVKKSRIYCTNFRSAVPIGFELPKRLFWSGRVEGDCLQK